MKWSDSGSTINKLNACSFDRLEKYETREDEIEKLIW